MWIVKETWNLISLVKKEVRINLEFANFWHNSSNWYWHKTLDRALYILRHVGKIALPWNWEICAHKNNILSNTMKQKQSNERNKYDSIRLLMLCHVYPVCFGNMIYSLLGYVWSIKCFFERAAFRQRCSECFLSVAGPHLAVTTIDSACFHVQDVVSNNQVKLQPSGDVRSRDFIIF